MGRNGDDSEPEIPGSGLAGCCLSAVVSHGLPLSPVGPRFLRWVPQTRPSLENQPRERKSVRVYCWYTMASSPYNIPLFIKSIKRTRTRIPSEMLHNEIEAGHGTQSICMEMSALVLAGINAKCKEGNAREAIETV